MPLLMLLLLGISALLWTVVLPANESELAAVRVKLLQTSQLATEQAWQAPVVTQETTQDNWQALHDRMGSVQSTEREVAHLFSLITALGLEWPAGQYKLSCETEVALCKYRIELPLHGSYRQLRGLVDQSLATLLNASLDGLSLRRESVASDELEANLVLTLFLAPTDRAEARRGVSP